MKLALSFVIPLYHSAETIGSLVKRIEALTIEGGHEIVLVNEVALVVRNRLSRFVWYAETRSAITSESMFVPRSIA